MTGSATSAPATIPAISSAASAWPKRRSSAGASRVIPLTSSLMRFQRPPRGGGAKAGCNNPATSAFSRKDRQPRIGMTELKQKVTNALNETRMLVLGAQILIGFQFQAAFREGFAKLSRAAQ